MNYTLVSVPSTFPPSQRPIYIHPCGPMTKSSKDDTLPLIIRAVRVLLDRHATDRVLIHTVSYDYTSRLLSALSFTHRPRLVSYLKANERQRAIDTYIHTAGAVLLAPSLDRGIDLPSDDCRAIIIIKVPYPHLGDKQVSARLHSPGGQSWYSVQTIRTLVQMTGRGMRSSDDHCASYILDSQFLEVYRRNKHLFPSWWREALVMSAGSLI